MITFAQNVWELCLPARSLAIWLSRRFILGKGSFFSGDRIPFPALEGGFEPGLTALGSGEANLAEGASAVLGASMVERSSPFPTLPHSNHGGNVVKVKLLIPFLDHPAGAVGDGLEGVVFCSEDGDPADEEAFNGKANLAGAPTIPGEL